jgi:hypothetical protein
VQLASTSEARDGALATKAVTPAGLKAASYGFHTLTDATTIAFDVGGPSLYRVTIAGNRTIAATTGWDGQRILFQVTASGGDRTLTLPTGVVDGFKFGTDITSIPVIVNGTTTFIGCIYRTASQRWHVLAVSSGH